jgi:hypothetical protein
MQESASRVQVGLDARRLAQVGRTATAVSGPGARCLSQPVSMNWCVSPLANLKSRCDDQCADRTHCVRSRVRRCSCGPLVRAIALLGMGPSRVVRCETGIRKRMRHSPLSWGWHAKPSGTLSQVLHVCKLCQSAYSSDGIYDFADEKNRPACGRGEGDAGIPEAPSSTMSAPQMLQGSF